MKLKQLFENEVPSIDRFNPKQAYDYALKQDKRVPELEPVIMKVPMWVYLYAINVIKGKWPEAEPIIMKNPELANAYLRDIPEARTPSKDVPLVIGKYALMDVPNTITDEQVEKLIKLLEPSATHLYNIKRYRTYVESIIKRKLQQKELYLISIEQLQNYKKEKEYFMKRIGVLPYNQDFE